MAITYHRFNDFAAMVAWAQAHYMANAEGEWQIEAHIYEEQGWYRPGVTLFNERNDMIQLRWYAFADEEGIDFPRYERVKARDKGGDYVNKLLDAINALA